MFCFPALAVANESNQRSEVKSALSCPQSRMQLFGWMVVDSGIHSLVTAGLFSPYPSFSQNQSLAVCIPSHHLFPLEGIAFQTADSRLKPFQDILLAFSVPFVSRSPPSVLSYFLHCSFSGDRFTCLSLLVAPAAF